MLRRAVLGASLLMAAGAAMAQVGAPQLGWVPDGTRIRPVYGIPAAAAIGAALPDHDFARIAASPARNYVLVSAAETGIVSVYTVEHGLIPLEGAGIAPDTLVLSPNGSAAALWFNSINHVQVVTGLPDAPAIRQIDASFLGSAPDALAVSDDGSWLAGTWTAGVFAFGPHGEANRLPLEDRAAALAFLQGTHDLAAAGPAGLEVVAGIGGFAVITRLLTTGDSAPVAIAATSGNRTLVLADRSGSVTVVDIVSGAASTTDCGCHPEGLFGMGPSAFRLTGLADGAIKLFDAARGEVFFAPLALEAAQDAGAGQ